jgi:hypothetical protein
MTVSWDIFYFCICKRKRNVDKNGRIFVILLDWLEIKKKASCGYVMEKNEEV